MNKKKNNNRVGTKMRRMVIPMRTKIIPTTTIMIKTKS